MCHLLPLRDHLETNDLLVRAEGAAHCCCLQNSLDNSEEPEQPNKNRHTGKNTRNQDLKFQGNSLKAPKMLGRLLISDEVRTLEFGGDCAAGLAVERVEISPALEREVGSGDMGGVGSSGF